MDPQGGCVIWGGPFKVAQNFGAFGAKGGGVLFGGGGALFGGGALLGGFISGVGAGFWRLKCIKL